MSQSDVDLQAAIENAYTAFAKVPFPRRLDASPYRDGDGTLAALSAAPLRALSGEQIGPYAGWAITTVGSADDYRHFLPRIFELSVLDPTWLGIEPPIMADKLLRAQWRQWPSAQRSAVLDFFRAAFRWAIERHPDEYVQADLWCCGLIILGDSPALTFERWQASVSPNAALNLASFIIGEAKHLRRHGEVRAPFWGDIDIAVRQDVARRLTAQETKVFLQSAATRASADDCFYLLDAAIAELSRQD